MTPITPNNNDVGAHRDAPVFKPILTVLVLILSLHITGCNGCSSEEISTNWKDGGPDGDSDTDSDTDTDSDSDSDTDTDSDSDPFVVPDDFVGDAGPWDWKDLPDAGDCGQEGCRQLTFSDEVRVWEWDVWGDLLTFNDETLNTRIVDHKKGKQLLLPNVHSHLEISAKDGVLNCYPATISKNIVCYGNGITQGTVSLNVICADLEAQTQWLVHREKNMDTNLSKSTDLYGDRFVSMGGCGEPEEWPLCTFDITTPGSAQPLIEKTYGFGNSLWEDILVWSTTSTFDNDIKGYNFATKKFFEITNDEQTQLEPKIYKNRVVYFDLKLGDSNSSGTWEHSAIFMYDLDTKETTQITSGESIASHPDIYENIIVWADYRDSSKPNDKNSLSGVQIWGYNLDTKKEFQITNIPNRPKAYPRIWGDNVFVDMYQTTSGNAIYMFSLPPEAQ